MELGSWSIFVGKLALTVGGKILLNEYVPGSGTVVDFVQAVTCFFRGDGRGGVEKIITGAADLATGGGKDALKEHMKVMKENAKTMSDLILHSSIGGHPVWKSYVFSDDVEQFI